MIVVAATAAAGLVLQTVAGLALVGTLGAALTAAAAEAERRAAATVTFVVSASGVTFLGISAPFRALVAGLGLLTLQRLGRPAPRRGQDARVPRPGDA